MITVQFPFSSRTRLIFIITALVLIIAGFAWFQSTFKRIIIDVNGTQYTVNTSADTVEGALDSADIFLDPADIVSPDLRTEISADMTINIIRARQMALEVDGELQRIYSHETDPMLILAEQNITLGVSDRLFVNHQPYSTLQPDVLPRHLKVSYGKSFRIDIDGETIALGSTQANTVGQLLADENIILYIADSIAPLPSTPLTDGIAIQITRSSPVTIEVDNTTLNTRTIGATVNDVLNDVGLPLTGKDYTLPASGTPFVAGMTISIVRVIERIEHKREPIPYQTFSFPSIDLAIGDRIVAQTGVEGMQETSIKIREENGMIVSQFEQGTWIVSPPINEIIMYGASGE